MYNESNLMDKNDKKEKLIKVFGNNRILNRYLQSLHIFFIYTHTKSNRGNNYTYITIFPIC